jgi:hypothetical protein
VSIRISNQSRWWPGGRVPFEINRVDFPAGSAEDITINGAINFWNTNTPIRMTPHNGEMNFAVFVAAIEGCFSPVGMVGGRQIIGCNLSTFGMNDIIHEIGHTIGFWHEMSRADRDSFISIRPENIQPDRLHNFAQHIDDGDDIGTYDYNSIMHYGTNTFAIDTALPTIIAPVPIGGATVLSPGDLNCVQITYQGLTGWHLMVGKLKHVSVGSASSIWGTSSDDKIWRWTGSDWQEISGRLKQISVATDGTVWGTSSDDKIWRWTGSDWQEMPGLLKHVSVGSASFIWGTSSDDKIWRWTDSNWQEISGRLKQISVATDETVWGTSSDDKIWRWTGSNWQEMPGLLKHVSVGSASSIWGTSSDDKIWRWTGSNWQKISGRLKQISVATDGTVWGTSSDDKIWRR